MTFAIASALLFFVGAAFLLRPNSENNQNFSLADLGSFMFGSQTPASELPNGFAVYENRAFNFSIAYPKELSVKEYAEGNDAITITLEDAEVGKGFQIFIVPYAESQISEERFKKDISSGVRTSTENVVIDGAPGAAFYSMTPNLGETREVWFIHGGYLYEVTTLKPLEEWLAGILQTWKFIR